MPCFTTGGAAVSIALRTQAGEPALIYRKGRAAASIIGSYFFPFRTLYQGCGWPGVLTRSV